MLTTHGTERTRIHRDKEGEYLGKYVCIHRMVRNGDERNGKEWKVAEKEKGKTSFQVHRVQSLLLCQTINRSVFERDRRSELVGQKSMHNSMKPQN